MYGQIKQWLHDLSQGSLDIIPVWKFFGMNLRIFNPFLFVNVVAWKYGWLSTTRVCNAIFYGLKRILCQMHEQILMLDPLALVAKVFNLSIQKEWQRTIGSSSHTLFQSLAFSASLSLSQLPFLKVSLSMIAQFVFIVGSWGILWTVATSYMGTNLGISPNPRPNWALFNPQTIHPLSLRHQRAPTSLI